MDVPFGLMPDQALPEYTDEDYLKTLRWISRQYNQRYNNVPSYSTGVAVAAGNNGNYLAEYADNLTYVFGAQIPADFNFFTTDENGNSISANMFRGLDVYKIFNFLHGEATDLIDPLPKTINVSALSEGAVSKKKDMHDYVALQLENKVWLEHVQRLTGFGFAPAKNVNPKKVKSMQHELEIAYERIARHATYINSYQVKLPKAFDYMVIGNLAMICVEYNNGQVQWRIVPPESAIVDYTKGLDVHLEDDFAGEVVQMTVPQLLEAYDWSEKEQEELKAIANNSSSITENLYSMVLSNNLYWWTQSNGVPKANVVKAEWVSMEPAGDGQYKRIRREGVLIGDKWLRGQKKSLGQIPSRGDRSFIRSKYIALTPNLFMGTSVSLVGIIKRYQNLKDAFITRVIDMVSTSIGKTTIIRASQLPEGLRAPDVISQLKRNRIFVMDGEDTEEGESPKMVETIDLSLDSNIQMIFNLAQEIGNIISDVLNIPDLVRGQVAGYKSGKQIETTKTQSTKGLSHLFKSFEVFEKELLSYSANLFKSLAPEDELGRDNLTLIVGDAATEILSMDTVKEMQFEDFLLALNPNDYISAEDKAEITQVALQTASSGLPTKVLKNYIAIKRSESLTEAYDYLDEQVEMDEAKEAEMQTQQQEAAKENTMINSQVQDKVSQRQTDLTLQLRQMEDQMKKYEADLKASTEKYKADVGFDGKELAAKIDLLVAHLSAKSSKESSED